MGPRPTGNERDSSRPARTGGGAAATDFTLGCAAPRLSDCGGCRYRTAAAPRRGFDGRSASGQPSASSWRTTAAARRASRAAASMDGRRRALRTTSASRGRSATSRAGRCLAKLRPWRETARMSAATEALETRCTSADGSVLDGAPSNTGLRRTRGNGPASSDGRRRPTFSSDEQRRAPANPRTLGGSALELHAAAGALSDLPERA